MVKTKTELSPRITFHAVFALTIIVLLFLKVSFVRIYKQFYGQVKTIGLLIALITFGMVGTSGGYYLIITHFGTEKTSYKVAELKEEISQKGIIVQTDTESIKKGKELYENKCSFCHNPYGTDTIVGPGHKDVLKNQTLPSSKKPATPDNIATQLKSPYKDMPSFSYLSEDDVQNIIAFLNTL